MRRIFIFVLPALFGCSSLPSQLASLGQIPSQPAVSSDEKMEFQHIESSVRKGDNESAIKLADAFASDHPYSVKLQESRFLKAQALESMGHWQEAGDTYRGIVNYSEKNQPEIAALSNYRLSYVYEALGDNENVLSSLLTAKSQSKWLPLEVARAEIPSRLAMTYAKENNADEAQKWLLTADEGLRQVLLSQHLSLTPGWLAEMYYNMGSISTDQVNDENVLTLLQGQRAVQKYLIHALQYGDSEWSKKALEKLKATYENFWQQIQKDPNADSSDAVVAQKIKIENQQRLAKPLAGVLKEAALYKPAPEQSSNEYQKEFFEFVAKMQSQVQEVLEKSLTTPVAEKIRPPRKVKSPAKIVPSQDPNL